MQIQRFESITQKYPQLPTALLVNEEPIQNGEPFILYGTKLDMTKLEKFQQKCGQNFPCFCLTYFYICRFIKRPVVC